MSSKDNAIRNYRPAYSHSSKGSGGGGGGGAGGIEIFFDERKIDSTLQQCHLAKHGIFDTLIGLKSIIFKLSLLLSE